jgi:hypothetical protein
MSEPCKRMKEEEFFSNLLVPITTTFQDEKLLIFRKNKKKFMGRKKEHLFVQWKLEDYHNDYEVWRDEIF